MTMWTSLKHSQASVKGRYYLLELKVTRIGTYLNTLQIVILNNSHKRERIQ